MVTHVNDLEGMAIFKRFYKIILFPSLYLRDEHSFLFKSLFFSFNKTK